MSWHTRNMRPNPEGEKPQARRSSDPEHHTTQPVHGRRMTKFVATAAFVLVSLAPRPGAAQSGPAGRWTTEFDIGIRNENGGETSMGKRHATITLTVKGDSVIGTWLVAAEAGATAPAPINLKGKVNGTR